MAPIRWTIDYSGACRKKKLASIIRPKKHLTCYFRLCSNIISHIKGGVTPSLLNEGGKRIQAFLDSEFSANTNTDQAKVTSLISVLISYTCHPTNTL